MRWLVLDMKVHKCTNMESMPGFRDQRIAITPRWDLRCASHDHLFRMIILLRLKMCSRDLGTSEVVIKWMELHFDRGVPCQVHIRLYPRMRYTLVCNLVFSPY